MNDPSPPRDSASRPARALVGVLLVLLVAAAFGIEAWPLTGWRLFSATRDESQTLWVVEAVDMDGSTRVVDFDELPFAYSEAAWPIAELPGASSERREAVCQALLKPVREVEPDVVRLNLARDRARLLERGGEWTVVDDLEMLHTCAVEPTDGGAS